MIAFQFIIIYITHALEFILYCPTMKTIQQDLKSSDLNMDDSVDLTQNHTLWRLMSTFGAKHS